MPVFHATHTLLSACQLLKEIWPYCLGFAYAVVLAHFLVQLLVDDLWRALGWQGTGRENVRPTPIHSKVVGFVERTLYLAAILLNAKEFVGLWLVLKATGSWKRWSEDKENIAGRSIFNIFLIGSGLNVAYSAFGAQAVMMSLNQEYLKMILLLIALPAGTLVLWWWWKQKSMMTLFRVDIRNFNKGDMIENGGLWASRIMADKYRKRVEEVLELHRSSRNPKRGEGVRVFDSKDEAVKLWSYTPNGKIYRVKASPADLLHVGDMMLAQDIYTAVKANKNAEQLAKSYWAGDMSKDHVLEYVVKKVEVVEVIKSDEEERLAYLRKKVTDG